MLNAGVLSVAVCMLGWHNLWMARHARQMADAAKDIGRQVAAGSRPLTALGVIAGVAVLREGSEIVLFVYSVAAASHDGPFAMLAGGLLGLTGGIMVEVILYYGLLRIPVHRLFAVTGWMVLLLAAGLAAQASGFLVQADLLPALGDQIWNTSFLLSEEGLVGKTLHTLVGYVARPAGVQIVAYVFVLAAIGLPMRVLARAPCSAHEVACRRARRTGRVCSRHIPRMRSYRYDCRLSNIASWSSSTMAFSPSTRTEAWAANRATRTRSATV